MDVETLRQCAEHLEAALLAHQGESEDVHFLIAQPWLRALISEARGGLIREPKDLGLGLGRWMLESNICDYDDISNLLAEFGILLRGWKLPAPPSWATRVPD